MIEFMRTTDFTLFDLFNYLRMLVFFLFLITQIKSVKSFPGRFSGYITNNIKNEKSRTKASTFFTVFEIIIFFVINCLIIGYYAGWFGKLVDMKQNYFGVIIIGPFIFALVCFILGIDIIKAFDICAPAYAISLTVSKFGCFTAGCCYGIDWENGLYSYAHEKYEFPVQLVESACALLIFFVLLLIRKKAKSGTLFPTFMILYSSTRFISEFTRHEPDVIGRLKVYHLCCIAGVVVGIIFLLIALFLSEKISRLFTCRIPVPEGLGAEISFNYHRIRNKLTKKDKKPIQHHKKRKKK